MKFVADASWINDAYVLAYSVTRPSSGQSISLSVLTSTFQVFIEAKDDGGGGDYWTTGAIGRTKL